MSQLNFKDFNQSIQEAQETVNQFHQQVRRRQKQDGPHKTVLHVVARDSCSLLIRPDRFFFSARFCYRPAPPGRPPGREKVCCVSQHGGDTRRPHRVVEGHQPSSRTGIGSNLTLWALLPPPPRNDLQRATGVHASDHAVGNLTSESACAKSLQMHSKGLLFW